MIWQILNCFCKNKDEFMKLNFYLYIYPFNTFRDVSNIPSSWWWVRSTEVKGGIKETCKSVYTIQDKKDKET